VHELPLPDWSLNRVHIELRSLRKPGDRDILVEWANEAWQDPNADIADPDPKSKSGISVRLIGYSPSAGFVITVIAFRQNGVLWGSTAWPSSRAERRIYDAKVVQK